MNINDLLEKEKNSGYHNSSVFGGFSVFINNWAQGAQLSETANLAEQYGIASLKSRPDILLKLSESIPQKQRTAPLPATDNDANSTGGANKAATTDIWAVPLTQIKNIGSKRAEHFHKLGISNLRDLLEYYPRDYRDRRTITLIKDAPIGSQVSIRGTVISCEIQRTRGRLTILRCYLRDESGILPVIWFNQPFLQKRFYPGRELIVFGKMERRFSTIELVCQDYQLADDIDGSATGIVPIYSAAEGISQKTIRNAINSAWNLCGNGKLIENIIPPELMQQHQLFSRAQALAAIHFPEDFADIEKARRTLAYEELLTIQLAILSNRQQNSGKIIRPQPTQQDAEILNRFQQLLPYPLTKAQKRVIGEIYADMNHNKVMTRLVQGDVGSGKTAVAAAAVAKCCLNGQQAAMMAPTELLARQHYDNLSSLLNQLGITNALLTANTPAKEKKLLLAQLAEGNIDFVVGTHSLIQEGVNFIHLGLAITDEQHRFGVSQRARLRGDAVADTLIMTATPIPRTLAMTVYADMDLSVIDELPPGRKPVHTYAVDYSYEDRIHAFIAKEVAQGKQAFIVCPLIEDSETLDLASAKSYYQRLRAEVFPQLKIGLLHGKMKADEKNKIMEDFKNGLTNILVATTVIEVGIDIPNASIMLIRDAERFGLAQLHQLRGRVGRGNDQGICILIHNAQSDTARERMKIICESTDGFALAEADLRLRGPGEFFGKKQHGLPSLKIANIFKDQELLIAARNDAEAIIQGDIANTATLAYETRKLMASWS